MSSCIRSISSLVRAITEWRPSRGLTWVSIRLRSIARVDALIRNGASARWRSHSSDTVIELRILCLSPEGSPPFATAPSCSRAWSRASSGAKRSHPSDRKPTGAPLTGPVLDQEGSDPAGFHSDAEAFQGSVAGFPDKPIPSRRIDSEHIDESLGELGHFASSEIASPIRAIMDGEARGKHIRSAGGGKRLIHPRRKYDIYQIVMPILVAAATSSPNRSNLTLKLLGSTALRP